MDIQSQIDDLQRAVGEQCTIRMDYPFEANLISEVADTMQLMLAVCEAAKKIRPVLIKHNPVFTYDQELLDALAALEKSCTT